MRRPQKRTKIFIVAEKPIQGREIADALMKSAPRRELPQGGVIAEMDFGELIVSWAEGHLMEMCKPDDLNPEWGSPWRLEVLPIVPEDHTIRQRARNGSSARLNTLGAWMNEATEIVNACDAGQEGELIFDEICRYAGLDQANPRKGVTFSRMWISDTRAEGLYRAYLDRTQSTLVKACHAREAAWARCEADWLWGMNMSRYATLTLGRPELPLISIGRVQTPLLGEIAENDSIIATFVPDRFEFAPIRFRGVTGAHFEARLVAFPELRHGNVDHHFKPGAAIRDIHRELVSSMAVHWKVTDMEEPREEFAPPPFDLADLQRCAFRIYRWSAQKTLGLAQTLYAKEKAITYPRTESNQVPVEMRDQVFEVRDKLYYGWALDRFPELKNAELPADDAHFSDKCGEHHAILPTGLIPQAWDANQQMRDEYKLWQLITVRTILSWLPSARIAAVKRLMMRPWGTDTVIRAFVEAEPVEDPGWLFWEDKMMNTRGIGKPLAERMKEVALPDAGHIAEMLGMTIRFGHTAPPKPHDEESVLGWMQRNALGTAATRHSIIEDLINRDYIVRTDHGQFRASASGQLMVGLLKTRLGDEVTGIPQARQIEEMVERIGGMAQERPTRERLWDVLIGRIRTAGAKLSSQEIDPNEAYCPRTGIRAVLHTSGKFWEFAGYPGARCWREMRGRKMSAPDYAGIFAAGDRGYKMDGFVSQAGGSYDAAIVWRPRKKKFELVRKR